jgi:ADP-heptose:LPS heptosyltransferase
MKILILLASGIGNSIMFSPTLSELKKNYPDSQIDIFAYKKAFAEPFSGSKIINKIYNYNGIKTILKLRKNNYDVSLTAFPSNRWQFNLFAFLVGAKKRLTHSYHIGKIQTLSFLQNYKILADEKILDVDQNLNLLKLLNLKLPSKKEVSFFIDKKNKEFAEKFIEKNKLKNKKLIGVHPGSGPLEYKRVPTSKFAELIKKNSNKDSVVLIFGSPDESKIKKDLQKKIKNKNYIIETNLKDTAALIKQCNLFITNDTGLMHIASTSKKTKIIALFNGTSYSRTSPYTKNAEIIILKENTLEYPFRSIKP